MIKKSQILKLYNETLKTKNLEIQKDFWAIINLFQGYELIIENSVFSEMLRNFINTVNKFFKYEILYNQTSRDDEF